MYFSMVVKLILHVNFLHENLLYTCKFTCTLLLYILFAIILYKKVNNKKRFGTLHLFVSWASRAVSVENCSSRSNSSSGGGGSSRKLGGNTAGCK